MLSFRSSVALASCYVVGAVAAWLAYPEPFSPARNWLSDLGSPELNPQGAVFYSIGVATAGGVTVSFFMALSASLHAGSGAQRSMLALTRGFGVLGGGAMIMSAAFPIGTPAHSFWSAAIYILLGTAFAFSVATTRYSADFPRSLGLFGVVVAGEDLVWSVALNTAVLEWLTVGLLIMYVVLLGAATRVPHHPTSSAGD